MITNAVAQKGNRINILQVIQQGVLLNATAFFFMMTSVFLIFSYIPLNSIMMRDFMFALILDVVFYYIFTI